MAKDDKKPAAGIELASMIQKLRSELTKAMEQAEGETLRFRAESIELELQVTVTRSGEGNLGVKFWVVEAGGGGKIEKASVQTVKVKLVPETVDASGKTGPALMHHKTKGDLG